MTPHSLRAPRLGALALALATAAFAAAPSSALASVPGSIFDTGTPTSGDGFGLAVTPVNWLAEEIHLDAGTTIGGLSTWLTGADVGETFTIALYGDRVKANGTELPDTADGGLLFSTQVTFTGNGWNGANGLSWHVAEGGNYWFSVQVNDGDTLGVADSATLPIGVSNAPLSVAFTDGNAGHFQSLGDQSPAYAFGLQVSAVPEPASVAMLLSGLLLLAARARRRSGRD